MQGNKSEKGRRTWSIEEKKGYRKRMVTLWEEKELFKVTEQRLADQALTILKSNWFTTVEWEEIKRNVDDDKQRMSPASRVRF